MDNFSAAAFAFRQTYGRWPTASELRFYINNTPAR